MKDNCPPEQMIIEAVQNGTMTDDLHHHLRMCDHCRELVWMTRNLNQVAESIRVPALPSADAIYGSVKPVVKHKGSVLLPIWTMHIISGLTAMLLALAALVTGRDAIPQVLGSIRDALGLSGATPVAQAALGVVGMASLIIVATVPILVSIFWFRDIWRERQLLH